jgi:DNA-binding NtrC family response regulator
MSPKVLLVEDDDVLQELCAEALSLLDAQVIVCPNADLALVELEQSDDINLVLTDIRMPGQMDGLQLAKVVAERWPELPIMVTSGNRMVGDALPPKAVFLAKPWTLDALFQSVKSVLSTTQNKTK